MDTLLMDTLCPEPESEPETTQCEICAWRELVLPQRPGEDSVECKMCRIRHLSKYAKEMEYARHEDPGELRKAILNQQRLVSPTLEFGSDSKYVICW